MKFRPHILIVPSWYSDPDNPILGSFFQEQAAALARRGAKVGVVYAETRSLPKLSLSTLRQSRFQITSALEDGIPTVRMHGWNPHIRSQIGARLWTRWTLTLMRRYATQYGVPDLVHSHSALWGGFAASVMCRTWHCPHVVTEHATGFAKNSFALWTKPFIRRTFESADAVLAVSSSLRELIQPYANDRQIEIIPNMVDVTFFDLPPAPRKTLPFRFLSLARLVPQKAMDVLIRAFAQAFRDVPDVLLEIGGKGEQREALEKLCQAENIQDKVRFLGPLSREEVRSALHSANAFVLASHIETFGVVFIEAMATGLPVIATRCGGPEEFVTPQVGLLIDSGDMEALAAALRLLPARSQEGAYPLNEIREYVVRRYSDAAVCDTLEAIYAQVSSRGQAAV